jgi:hypothetical protein
MSIQDRMNNFRPSIINKTMTHKYYVGDLCYVMHDVWNEVCDLTPFDNSECEFELEDGRKFILFSTAFGDGQYNDKDGRPYSVDSGTIGAIKVDDIRDPEFARVVENGLGHVHEFPSEINDMDCYCAGGVIGIYDVEIDTAADDEEEDFEEEGEDKDA